MGFLDSVVDISELGQRKLVVLYGKSGSGKTELGSTWPKPMLYVQIGDDGSNTIAGKDGILSASKKPKTVEDYREIMRELIKKKGAGYDTVFLDTFSMLTNVWTDENAVKKKKRMTQQMWGDLKIETEELVRMAHELSQYCWVLLSLHEATDSFEGLEEEILPDVRPSSTRGARTYLEGMANYGFHTTKLQKEVIRDGVESTVVKYAAHIGPNPYYWTKLQIDKGIKVPKLLINPTYTKIMEAIGVDVS